MEWPDTTRCRPRCSARSSGAGTANGPDHQPGAAARPLRADAQRNRDKLLRVAAEAFTDVGVDVPLEEIARRAGVGIGTFYRHFPTREALVVAVYRQQIDDLAAAARELPLVHPPADALREWMHAFVDYAAVKRGMVALLKSMMETDSHLFDDARATLYAAAGSLMTAAAEAGEIRPGRRSDRGDQGHRRDLHGHRPARLGRRPRSPWWTWSSTDSATARRPGR